MEYRFINCSKLLINLTNLNSAIRAVLYVCVCVCLCILKTTVSRIKEKRYSLTSEMRKVHADILRISGKHFVWGGQYSLEMLPER